MWVPTASQRSSSSSSAAGVAVGHEAHVLEPALERLAERGLAHERERAHRLAVEAAERRDEGVPLGVEPGELDRALDGVGAVVDEERVLEVARRHLGEHLRQRGPPGLQQLLAVERHAPELVGDGLDDLGMVDPGAEDAVAAQAVDVLATQEIVEDGALAAPLEGGELAGLGDGLAVGDEAAVVVPLVAVDRLGDERLLFFRRHLPPGDELQVPVGVLQDLGIRQSQLIGAPLVSDEFDDERSS